MEPAISTGSVVVIQKEDAYTEGQVITFGQKTSNSIPTTHRIVATEVQGGELVYLTKGDANEERDIEAISKEDVHGVVLLTIPALGFLLDFARKPVGFALLIGVPALIIVFEEASKIVAAIKMGRAKKEEDGDIEAVTPPSA